MTNILIKILRWFYNLISQEKPILSEVPEEEYVLVCSDCSEIVEEVGIGDEGWSVCSSCRQVEGGTELIKMSEYELKHGY